jgi:hypothetical protein
MYTEPSDLLAETETKRMIHLSLHHPDVYEEVYGKSTSLNPERIKSPVVGFTKLLREKISLVVNWIKGRK